MTANYPDQGADVRLRIMLIGHGCDPAMGSEPGVTWNWAYHLSKLHRVDVLAHPHAREKVEAFLRNNPNPNLTFHWVTLPKWIDPWDTRNPRGIRVHYYMWLRAAYAKARRLAEDIDFDVVHHVGWSTVSVASPFWKLGVPFVWGPLGGAQTTPKPLISVFGGRSWLERLRMARIRVLPLTPSIRRTVRKAMMVFATNRETFQVLEQCEAGKARLYSDIGLRLDSLPSSVPDRRGRAELTVLWVGRVVPLKCLELCLRSFALLDRSRKIRLRVIGDGSDLERCQRLSEELGLQDRVQFLGRIDWSLMEQHWREADIFIFTSVRDSFGSVLLEASSYGVPSICLDIGGAGTWLPSNACVRITPGEPAIVAADFARAMADLYDDVDHRNRLGAAARMWAEQQTWNRRAEQMTHEYNRVLLRQQSAVSSI